MFFGQILCWEVYINHKKLPTLLPAGFLKKRARNRPNSRLQFLSANFYVLGCYCTLLLHTTCVRSCCNWRASGVVASHTTNQNPSDRDGYFAVFRTSGLSPIAWLNTCERPTLIMMNYDYLWGRNWAGRPNARWSTRAGTWKARASKCRVLWSYWHDIHTNTPVFWYCTTEIIRDVRGSHTCKRYVCVCHTP